MACYDEQRSTFLSAGEILTSAAELAGIFGLSESQARRFIARLEKAGLVSSRPAGQNVKSGTILRLEEYSEHTYGQRNRQRETIAAVCELEDSRQRNRQHMNKDENNSFPCENEFSLTELLQQQAEGGKHGEN